jgi:hypothetical protein
MPDSPTSEHLLTRQLLPLGTSISFFTVLIEAHGDKVEEKAEGGCFALRGLHP